jgi:hypothetical protein
VKSTTLGLAADQGYSDSDGLAFKHSDLMKMERHASLLGSRSDGIWLEMRLYRLASKNDELAHNL